VLRGLLPHVTKSRREVRGSGISARVQCFNSSRAATVSTTPIVPNSNIKRNSVIPRCWRTRPAASAVGKIFMILSIPNGLAEQKKTRLRRASTK
jgi:hypothetical protein